MKSTFSENFPKSNACIFQWNYPVINLGRNELRNCCRTSPNIVKHNELSRLGPNIILNSPIERENRARMLLGEKVKACTTCWITEEKNMISARADYTLNDHEIQQSAPLIEKLNTLPTHEEKVAFLSQSELTYSKNVNMLEISLDNTCDMKCMYCSHHYSSRWAAERIKYKEILPNMMSQELPKVNPLVKENLLQWFEEEGAHSVNYINFIGGEPTLIDDYYELSLFTGKVLHSISRTNVTISVVTNLNCTADTFNRFANHIIELSKYFSYIDINISMEAFGEKAEYIRQGLKWKRWCDNLEKILQLPLKNVCISAQMATNVLSISSLHLLIDYFGQLIHKYNVPIHLRQNLVSQPTAHAPMLLTADFSQYIDLAIEKVQKYADLADSLAISEAEKEYNSWKKYVVFLDHLKSTIQNHSLTELEKKTVRDFFNTYESRQKISMYSVFPEYRSFFKSCGIADYTYRHKIAQRFKNRYYISKIIRKIFRLNLS